MVKKITNHLLNEIIEEAKHSVRKRKNFNYHTSFDDPVNRLLNAIEPGSYVQPHKHENPDKREVFLLLKGKLAVIFFNDKGKITDHVVLDGMKNYAVEIPPSVWHTIISLECGTIAYEVKDGPYSPTNDKNFADWAPKEGDEECERYLNTIITILNL